MSMIIASHLGKRVLIAGDLATTTYTPRDTNLYSLLGQKLGLFDDGAYVTDNTLKLVRTRIGIAAYAGDVKRGQNILDDFAGTAKAGCSGRDTMDLLRASLLPFTPGPHVEALFAVSDSPTPRLWSFNLSGNGEFCEHEAGGLVGLGTPPPIVRAECSRFSDMLQSAPTEELPNTAAVAMLLGCLNTLGLLYDLPQYGIAGPFYGAVVDHRQAVWQGDTAYVLADDALTGGDFVSTAFRHGVFGVASGTVSGKRGFGNSSSYDFDLEAAKRRFSLTDNPLDVPRPDYVVLCHFKRPSVLVLELARQRASDLFSIDEMVPKPDGGRLLTCRAHPLIVKSWSEPEVWDSMSLGWFKYAPPRPIMRVSTTSFPVGPTNLKTYSWSLT